MNRLYKVLVLLPLFIGLAMPHKLAGAADDVILPVFSDFVSAVTDGQANVVRGVYVPGVLALPVVQQPEEDPGSVSRVDGVATQFSTAAKNHVIGLLAHNYLAGAAFSNLKIGQEVRIVFGDGRIDYFTINKLARFQALQPDERTGDLVNLNTKVTYSTQEVFTMFYDGGFHVTFQTCILRNGNSSWGRLFVTAIPVQPFFLRLFLPLGLRPIGTW